MNKRIIHILLCLFLVNTLIAQTVEDVIEIRDASNYEWDLRPGEAVKDEQGNYYYYQLQYAKGPDPKEISDGGLNFNGVNIERGPLPDTISEYSYFVYVMKFSPDFELLASNIIMNVNYVENISYNNGHFSIAIHPRFQFPLIVDDTVYQSSLEDYESWVVIFNEDLEPVETLHFPSTEIKGAHLGKGSGEIFIGLSMREGTEYTVFGVDTIWNYSDTIVPGIEYTPTTGVITKYNYIENKYKWIRKFGDVWGQSEIQQMEVDPYGDIVVVGISGASSYVYIDEQSDSLPANGISIIRNRIAESVILKFSPSGEYLWGVTTPEALWDIFSKISIDPEGDIYVTASHENDSLVFRDTVLQSIGDTDKGFENRSLLAKFSRGGSFEWVNQLEGAYNDFYYFNVNARSSDYIYVTGISSYGNIEVGDSTIAFDESSPFYYITYKIGKEGGAEQLIYHSNGTHVRIHDAIARDNEKVTLLFRTRPGVEFFGLEYDNPEPIVFVKLDLSKTVNVVNKVARTTGIIYPNPINIGSDLTVEFKEETVVKRLIIYNMEGRPVAEKTNSGYGVFQVKIPDIPPGQYYIKCMLESGILIKPLIIQ